MSSYTQSIREILQYNKTPEQSLENVSDVYSVASECLFDKVPSGVISEEYWQQFVTGFTLHFMNEEIGYETLPLWKIALNEKIYNSGSYINKIFNNLDKEIFADYHVKQSATAGLHSITRHGTGTIGNVREDDTTTTSQDSATHSETVDNTVSGTVSGTGTVANAKTGSDTTSKTGTDTHTKTGDVETAKTGDVTTTKDGDVTTTKDGNIGHVISASTLNMRGGDITHTITASTLSIGGGYVEHVIHGSIVNMRGGDDKVEHRGTDKTYNDTNDSESHSGNLTETHSGKNTFNNNSVSVHSDTPMGSLSNLWTGRGPTTGEGVGFVTNGQAYNYMTAAQELDESKEQEDKRKIETEDTRGINHHICGSTMRTAGLTDTTYYHSKNDENINKTDRENRNTRDDEHNHSSDVETLNTQDKGSSNTNDVETFDTTDTETFDTTDTETFNTTDTETYNTTDTNTLNLQDQVSYGSLDTETRNTLDTTSKTDNTATSGSDSKSGTVVVDGTVTDTQTRNTTDTDEGTHSEDTSGTDYTLNWEMLYRSMPLLNKVWEIFDDLFMLIF